jgi:hypothetical protein
MFEEFQKLSAVRSYGEVNKGFQAINAKIIDYSKRGVRRRRSCP